VLRSEIAEGTIDGGAFVLNGTSGACLKRNQASRAPYSDRLSKKSLFNGLFCAPLANAPHHAVVRAQMISLALA
jgi:hypothetical protein